MGKAKDLATALYSVCTNTSVCSSCDCYEICHKYGIKPYDKYTLKKIDKVTAKRSLCRGSG